MFLARLLAPALALAFLPAPVPGSTHASSPHGHATSRFGSLFVQDGSRFLVQGSGIAATPEGFRFSVQDRAGTRQRWGVAADFVAARLAAPVPVDPTPARISYFSGSPEEWRTGLPTSEGLLYRDLWPGIDLAARTKGEGIKYEYRVAPGADPSRIRIAYRGAQGVRLRADGSLAVVTPAGAIVDDAPFAYQVRDGHRSQVRAAYDVAGSRVSFRLGAYDPARPLVIDPAVFVYSGFVGGDKEDTGSGIAADPAGNVYISGTTESAEATFPEAVGPDLTIGSATDPDAFVAKLGPGGALVYAGYIGGSDEERAFGVAVDPSGAAYVTGYTHSPDFPTTPGAFDTVFNPPGDSDAWVVKVSPGGALAYSTLLGGHSDDEGRAIAVDAAGAAYVTGVGRTDATPFPTTPGSFGTAAAGGSDAFIAKLNPAGSALVFSGLLGGSESDSGAGIALAPDGSVGIGGITTSTEATFPDKVGPDLTYNGGPGPPAEVADGFVARVDATGATLIHAGYLGGALRDQVVGVAMDPAGNLFATGLTSSGDFPALVGPDTTLNGIGGDGFITKIAPTGASLVYSGFLGGDSVDYGSGIAIEGAGSAVVVGATTSTHETFRLGGGPDPIFSGGAWDGYVARVDPSGSGLIGGSFIGGSGFDVLAEIVMLGPGDFAVAGSTGSREPHFPLIAGPDATYNGGTFDASVTRFQVSGSCFGMPATRFGTPGDDVFVGTPGPDVFLGLEGDDVLKGLGGEDRLCGGADDDRLVGGSGRDRLRGESGDDRLLGGAARDRLVGGGGRDVCNGGGGVDAAKKCEIAKRI